MTQSGTQCEHPALEGWRLCGQHLKMCKEYLQDYQQACKPTRERAVGLYKNAQWLVNKFFGSQSAARTFIQNAQNDLPTSSVTPARSSLSLNLLDSVVQPLLAKYQRMHTNTREKVQTLAHECYEEWRDC